MLYFTGYTDLSKDKISNEKVQLLRASCKVQVDLLDGEICQSVKKCIRREKTEENNWKKTEENNSNFKIYLNQYAKLIKISKT